MNSRSGAAAVLKNSFFLNCAPPPHPNIKPSRGWLRVGISKPRSVQFNSKATRNKVTAKEKTGVLGVQIDATAIFPFVPLHSPTSKRFARSNPHSPLVRNFYKAAAVVDMPFKPGMRSAHEKRCPPAHTPTRIDGNPLQLQVNFWCESTF